MGLWVHGGIIELCLFIGTAVDEDKIKENYTST